MRQNGHSRKEASQKVKEVNLFEKESYFSFFCAECSMKTMVEAPYSFEFIFCAWCGQQNRIEFVDKERTEIIAQYQEKTFGDPEDLEDYEDEE